MSTFLDIAILAIVLLLGSVGISFLRLSFLLAKSDLTIYERCRSRTAGFMRAARGQVYPKSDLNRDHRYALGITINQKTNEWVDQGKLSDEAISELIGG